MQCRGLAQSTVRTAATVAHGPQANAHTRLVMDVQELRGMNGRAAQMRMRMHPVMSARENERLAARDAHARSRCSTHEPESSLQLRTPML